jgi:hypothetical protein
MAAPVHVHAAEAGTNGSGGLTLDPAVSLVRGASVLSTPKTPTPAYGNIVTVLSIDGGGVRGIIPGTILAFLEEELQVSTSYSLCCCVYGAQHPWHLSACMHLCAGQC